jgi:hypothetical protein
MSAALSILETIQDRVSRSFALNVLAQYLPADLLGRGFAAANAIQSPYSRVRPMVALSRRLPSVLEHIDAADRKRFVISVLRVGLTQYRRRDALEVLQAFADGIAAVATPGAIAEIVGFIDTLGSWWE